MLIVGEETSFNSAVTVYMIPVLTRRSLLVDAKKLYDYVFEKEYSHLDIDTIENKLYRNFNLLEITKNGESI